MIANRSVPTDTILPHVMYQNVAEAIDSIDVTSTQAASGGGEIVEAPHTDFPGSASAITTSRDPAGNVIGLHRVGSQ